MRSHQIAFDGVEQRQWALFTIAELVPRAVVGLVRITLPYQMGRGQ